MSSDEPAVPIDKRFRVLVEIARASHFAWRQAVTDCCPQVDARDVVHRMWEITGVQTAEAYLKHIDANQDLARQLAESIVWSSLCMGEDAAVEESDTPGEYLVRHNACPWFRWHDQQQLLTEDRPGCDQWFQAAISTINDHLGCRLRFETLAALPDGADCCLRRIWRDER